MEVSGSMKPLPGQLKNDGDRTSPTAFFAICCPLGHSGARSVPYSDQDSTVFRTKYKLDMSITALDQQARKLLDYEDRILAGKRVYDLLHPDDLKYYSAGHKTLLAMGHVGFLAYRILASDLSPIWVQTNAQVMYKNGRPDCIFASHLRLSQHEGQDLIRKRDGHYKLPYPLGQLGSFNDVTDLRVEIPANDNQIWSKKQNQFSFELPGRLEKPRSTLCPRLQPIHPSVETVQEWRSSILRQQPIIGNEAVQHMPEKNQNILDNDVRPCDGLQPILDEQKCCGSSSLSLFDRQLSSSFAALLSGSHIAGFGDPRRISTSSSDDLTNISQSFNIGQCDALLNAGSPMYSSLQRNWNNSHCATSKDRSDAGEDHDAWNVVKVLKQNYIDTVASEVKHENAVSQKISAWKHEEIGSTSGDSSVRTQSAEMDRLTTFSNNDATLSAQPHHNYKFPIHALHSWYTSNGSGSEPPMDVWYLKNQPLFTESHHQRAFATTGYVGN